MNILIDWFGKAEDLTIAYSAGVRQTQMLPGDLSFEGNLPAIIYPKNDNIRDVADVSWEEDVRKADRLDYVMAICSGAISGIFDAFFVGEFSLQRANKWGSEKVNKFVKRIAKLQGFRGDDLADSIEFLEKKFRLAADSVTAKFGGGLQHHLRDFSHHFSLGGWLCSLFTQFTGKVIGTETDGALKIEELVDRTFIGESFEEKVLFGTITWFFHIVSDMAGSSAKAGTGTGIPGPLASLLKKISALPCFKDKKIGENDFYVWVSKLFNGTLIAKRDENGTIIDSVKFDLRTEIGILHEAGKQVIPVLINECLVRGLYFLRRFYNAIKKAEIHTVEDLKRIDSSELLPFNNRIIRRMITMASGTFAAIDTVDAAVRAAIKSKGTSEFFVDFAVRINVVGIGRFIVACKADARFITEDIRKAREHRRVIKNEYENTVSDLKALSLTYDQMRVLDSLEKLILEDDIKLTKNEKERKLKTEWMVKWSATMTDSLSLVSSVASEFFLPEIETIRYITENEAGSWLYLLAMEAMLFSPYYSIFNDEGKDKELKKIKLKSKYLTDRFVVLEDKITKTDFSNIKKAYTRAAVIVTGGAKNLVIGAVGTTAAIMATGGLAFAFAPAIATALVGEAAAGLSGAALVSYSLAAIGGGSLAAGGLGMAGGTAIITGGGALIGMLGGTGLSAATTINLLADDGYVLSECCKLIAFGKAILLGRYGDRSEVTDIQAKVEARLVEIKEQIDSFSGLADSEENAKKKKEMKIKTKIAKKSCKYLSRTADELAKMVKTRN